MKKLVLVLFISVLLASCGSMKPKTTLINASKPLPPETPVVVLNVTDEVPKEALKLAEIKLLDNGFTTKCKWDYVIPIAKNEARRLGGNILKITKHIKPSWNSSCDQIYADVYKIDDLKKLERKTINNNEKEIDSTKSYAIIHFYRPSSMGAAIGYNVFLNDKSHKLTRLKNNSKESVIVTSFGPQKIGASTEKKEEIELNIQPGREYYIEGTITYGALIGRPALRVVANNLGKKEYLKIPERRDFTHDYLLLKDGKVVKCEDLKEKNNTYFFRIKKKDKNGGSISINTSISKDRVKKVWYKQELIPQP